MKRHFKRMIGLLLAAAYVCSAAAEQPHNAESATQKLDSESGLKIAPGWETVKANCTACHSAKLITAHRGDRYTWLEMIRWMQGSQGLWPLDLKTENAILDYLASQYPSSLSGRRANLPDSAMPSNPWRQ